jgi:hypothetical protein
MNELTVILPLLTLLVGWLLGEATQRRRELSTDRRSVSRAIADLLEVRHRIYFIKSYVDKVSEKFKIPQEALPVLNSSLESFLPNIESLQKRYNDSVDAVASANPLLGFQLRSKDELPKMLNTLRQLASQDANVMLIYPKFEKQILDLTKAPLDDFILELAKAHGNFTHKKIKKYLSQPIVDQKKLNELLEGFQQFIK